MKEWLGMNFLTTSDSLRTFWQSVTVKNILVNLMGNGLALMVGTISLVIVSRLLGPKDFGLFSVIFGVFMLAGRLADAGVNFGMNRYVSRFLNQPKKSERFARASFQLKLVTTSVVILVGFGLTPLISEWLQISSEINLMRWVILFVWGIVAFEMVVNLLQARGQFIRSAVVNNISGLIKLIGLGMLLWWGIFQLPTVMTVYMVGPAAAAIIGLAWWGKLKLSFKPLPKETKLVAVFSGWMAVAVIASSLAEQLDVFLLSSLLDSVQAGIFAVANRLSQVLMVIPWSLGGVLSPRLAQFRRKKDVIAYLRKAVTGVVILALLMGVILPLAAPIIRLIFGESYVGAISPFRWLVVAVILTAATVPMQAIFYATNTPKAFALIAGMTLATVLGLELVLIPRFGATGAGIARVISAAVIFILTGLILLRELRRFSTSKTA